MNILEIFEDEVLDVRERLKQNALDIITPFVANNVPFITVQQVIDTLRNSRPGVFIDRGLIMNILEPTSIKLISKIEGDKIYLQKPVDDLRAASDDQEEKDIDHVKAKARDTAKKHIKKESANYHNPDFRQSELERHRSEMNAIMNPKRRDMKPHLPLPPKTSPLYDEIVYARSFKDANEYAEIAHTMGPIRNVDPPHLKAKYDKERKLLLDKYALFKQYGFV